ncbi:hypothetical protein [Komagataeibacter europaeus]|uniref:hypothetical protein n=1 Tax=Komagataeibacter europaeus TaxID=33995 RepID=UPI0002F58120|nr:hypothetical protein [Komagataeibacter europaeus]GBQ47898.1 hypothetical protein AA18890_2844 [Komagataeibacter europaeus LMG 18890]
MNPTENRIFIRPVRRIEDVRRADCPASNPLHIFGEVIMSVPVAPNDTVADVRQTIATMLEVHGAGLDASNSESQTPYTADDWQKAVAAFASDRADTDVFDPTALPYDDTPDQMRWPTNWLVQAIAIDDQAAALDLYMEVLGRAEAGESWRLDIAPASYLDDECFRLPDGSLWSRQDAAEDSGRNTEDGRAITLREIMTQH